MTVKELKEKLEDFNDDFEVYLDDDSSYSSKLLSVNLAIGEKNGQAIRQVISTIEETLREIELYEPEIEKPIIYCYLSGTE